MGSEGTDPDDLILILIPHPGTSKQFARARSAALEKSSTLGSCTEYIMAIRGMPSRQDSRVELLVFSLHCTKHSGEVSE